jgi:hypothetical protein
MATDAQGRLLSDDGNYYWDGSDWQLVSASGGDGATSSQSPQVTPRTDAQGRQLSEDGNYFWDGSDWQLVNAPAGAGAATAGQAGGAAAGGHSGGAGSGHAGGGAAGGHAGGGAAGGHAGGATAAHTGGAAGGHGGAAAAGHAGGAAPDHAGGAADGHGVTAEDIMNGSHALLTAAELLELFGTCPEALAVWVEPIDGVITIIEMVYNTIKAMETEERGAGFRGTAYGTVYGALGMGVPSAMCSGSIKGHEQDQLDQKAFDEGAREAVSKVSDAVSKNRVIVRIAQDGNDPGKTVNAIYQHLCSESGDRELAMAYDNLAWPGPVCA